MSNENIIKDTVLKKREEGTACFPLCEWESSIVFETRRDNGRKFDIKYHIINSADIFRNWYPHTFLYQIILENVEDSLDAYWEQLEDSRGNLLSLEFGMIKWRHLRTQDGYYTSEKQTIFDLKGKSIEDIMLPVVKKAFNVGSFVDTWNNLIASRTHKNYGALYARAEQLFEKAIRAHEIVGARKKDPEWQAICKETQQLYTTKAGKANARQMVQAYLRREQQNFKQ